MRSFLALPSCYTPRVCCVISTHKLVLPSLSTPCCLYVRGMEPHRVTTWSKDCCAEGHAAAPDSHMTKFEASHCSLQLHQVLAVAHLEKVHGLDGLCVLACNMTDSSQYSLDLTCKQHQVQSAPQSHLYQLVYDSRLTVNARLLDYVCNMTLGPAVLARLRERGLKFTVAQHLSSQLPGDY